MRDRFVVKTKVKLKSRIGGRSHGGVHGRRHAGGPSASPAGADVFRVPGHLRRPRGAAVQPQLLPGLSAEVPREDVPPVQGGLRGRPGDPQPCAGPRLSDLRQTPLPGADPETWRRGRLQPAPEAAAAVLREGRAAHLRGLCLFAQHAQAVARERGGGHLQGKGLTKSFSLRSILSRSEMDDTSFVAAVKQDWICSSAGGVCADLPALSHYWR